MTSIDSFHVLHLNPEEMTKARFCIFLNFRASFDHTSQLIGICGNIAQITFKAEYWDSVAVCQMYASVSENPDHKQPSSFKFVTDFPDSLNAILNTKAGWQYIGRINFIRKGCSVLKYSLTLELINDKPAPYKELYNDTHHMDFELRGEDGDDQSVRVHRSILAVSSPVLKTMLLGDWNEAKQGHVKVPGVSKVTLQHFKDYLYLKEFPKTPMECAKLLPLASYYMMPELERDCTMQIAESFKPEDGWDWLEYFVLNTVQQKTYNLLAILLKNINSDKTKALEEHFSKLSICTE